MSSLLPNTSAEYKAYEEFSKDPSSSAITHEVLVKATTYKASAMYDAHMKEESGDAGSKRENSTHNKRLLAIFIDDFLTSPEASDLNFNIDKARVAVEADARLCEAYEKKYGEGGREA